MIFEQLSLMTYPTQTSGVSASRAKTSASQASKKACKKVSEADCFTKLCDCLPAVGKKIDLNGCSLKMLKIYLALETDLISRGCCVKWGGTGILSNGTLSTAKTTVFPKTGSACSLTGEDMAVERENLEDKLNKTLCDWLRQNKIKPDWVVIDGMEGRYLYDGHKFSCVKGKVK